MTLYAVSSDQIYLQLTNAVVDLAGAPPLPLCFVILSKETHYMSMQFIYLILLFPQVVIALNDESVNFIREDLPSDDALKM